MRGRRGTVTGGRRRSGDRDSRRPCDRGSRLQGGRGGTRREGAKERKEDGERMSGGEREKAGAAATVFRSKPRLVSTIDFPRFFSTRQPSARKRKREREREKYPLSRVSRGEHAASARQQPVHSSSPPPVVIVIRTTTTTGAEYRIRVGDAARACSLSAAWTEKRSDFCERVARIYGISDRDIYINIFRVRLHAPLSYDAPRHAGYARDGATMHGAAVTRARVRARTLVQRVSAWRRNSE